MSEATVSALSVTNHSHPFIFRLPAEILETIFIHGAREYHTQDEGFPTPRAPRWVNVSYTCRLWRNIALNCPTLWSYPFITSPRWTEELLARSKTAPLRLKVRGNDSHETLAGFCFVEQAMVHIERIEELRIHLPCLFRSHRFFPKLSSPAPLLQCLEISALAVPPEWGWPSVFFAGDTPALHTLVLSFPPVSWYTFKLSGLTTLILHHMPARFRQNIPDLLCALNCMQDLIHLCLDHVLAGAANFLSSAMFHAFRKVNLYHLSRLWIAAPLSTVTAFLSCVNFPWNTEISLECDFEGDSSPDGYAPLSSLLAQRFTACGNQPTFGLTIRSLTIGFGYAKVIFTFSASERDLDLRVPLTEWEINVPLQIIVHPQRTERDRITSDICCSIPLPNVQSLHVINPPHSSAFWERTLGYFRDLRCLKLSQGWMPDLASVLSLAPHGHMENHRGYGDPDSDRMFAPALEELYLHEISFSGPVESIHEPSSDDVLSLYAALDSRKESQGQLTIAKCDIDGVMKLDMFARWGDGHFRVLEETRESSALYTNSPEPEESDSSEGASGWSTD